MPAGLIETCHRSVTLAQKPHVSMSLTVLSLYFQRRSVATLVVEVIVNTGC